MHTLLTTEKEEPAITLFECYAINYMTNTGIRNALLSTITLNKTGIWNIMLYAIKYKLHGINRDMDDITSGGSQDRRKRTRISLKPLELELLRRKPRP
jgi:hypothetical protein